MSEHKIKLSWQSDGSEFKYQSYTRNHILTFENGVELEASAAAAYLGDPTKVDPENLYVASLSSCHMLTFLAMCAKQKLSVESYIDDAVGHLAKGENGILAVTKVILQPKIKFSAGVEVSGEVLNQLQANAHKYCFIANSVKTEIEIAVE